MNKPDALAVPGPAAPAPASAGPLPRRFWIAFALVTAAFGPALFQWARFALGSDLYSYTLLIPAISAYMVWSSPALTPTPAAPRRLLAAILLALALLGLAVSLLAPATAGTNAIAAGTVGFVLAVSGTAAWFLDPRTLRRLAFPLGFLLFMVPLPPEALRVIETAMQHGSAAVAHAFFGLAGTPVFYESLMFQLPSVALHVAPECSGIRSTLVLLVVSVVTSFYFLRSTPARVILAAAIVPLALLRNGFRIFVIGEICVRYGPEMIDSFIHRRGGPVFFALSLVPLFFILVLLQRREARALAR